MDRSKIWEKENYPKMLLEFPTEVQIQFRKKFENTSFCATKSRYNLRQFEADRTF